MPAPDGVVLRCVAPDRIGLVATVTGFLARQRLSVVESHDFGDPDTGRFFMRIEFKSANGAFDRAAFEMGFAEAVAAFDMEWSVRPKADRPKMLLLASKADHCLSDLLHRRRRGELAVEIPAVVSNHVDAEWHAERHGLPFVHIPVTKDAKAQAEDALLALFEETGAELVVLARYMQVLSDDLARRLEGRCINIHHSFLPSFKGARPYHQAHTRGVKLIGATAHYVTAALDEGPIIAQDAAPVDHRATPAHMIARGREIEARVLARAVRAHAEGRIFLNGRKTVVFD
ncbi:MAG: formyltetrahydrofolate deformylase [Pseudomonadota bacterium]